MSTEDLPKPVENPHSWWRHPIQAGRWKRLQALHREYAGIRVDVNEFEVRWLVPELRGRAVFMKEEFVKMKDICRRPELPMLIEAPFRTAMGPGFPMGSAEATAAIQQYFAQTEKMIDESYLGPLDEIVSFPPVVDVTSLVRFLQKMLFLSESILRSKDALFTYRFQHQLCVTETATGRVIVGPPGDHVMVLNYFQVTLNQLVRCAEATAGTIQHWKEQVEGARKPFLEFLAASTNAATSRRTIVVQLLAILIALSFSALFLTLRDPFSLSRENKALRLELRELQTRLAPYHSDGGVP